MLIDEMIEGRSGNNIKRIFDSEISLKLSLYFPRKSNKLVSSTMVNYTYLLFPLKYNMAVLYVAQFYDYCIVGVG